MSKKRSPLADFRLEPPTNTISVNRTLQCRATNDQYFKRACPLPDNNQSTSTNGSTRSSRSRSMKDRLDPNFVQIVSVNDEFPDRNLVPRSIANLSHDDEIANFYPVIRKGPNYLNYCRGFLSNSEKPASVTECIRKYTSDPDWFCTEINLALATDSPRLSHYSPYIRQLKYSIGTSPMNFTGTVFRGVDMSPSEVSRYEQENMFFIPSFTSTSKQRPFRRSTWIHIDISPEWSTFCMEIQPEHTRYPREEEILFSCYNLYRYLRTEKSANQLVIKLELVNYHRYFDYHQNIDSTPRLRSDNSTMAQRRSRHSPVEERQAPIPNRSSQQSTIQSSRRNDSHSSRNPNANAYTPINQDFRTDSLHSDDDDHHGRQFSSQKKNVPRNIETKPTPSNKTTSIKLVSETPVRQTHLDDDDPRKNRVKISENVTTHRFSPDVAPNRPAKQELSGRKTVLSTVAPASMTNETVNFHPVLTRGRCYLKYCTGRLTDEEKPLDVNKCVRKYLCNSSRYLNEINLDLATDSPRLFLQGPHVRHFKYSVGVSQMDFSGTVFFDGNMSTSDVSNFESQNMFFLPNFLLTSKRPPPQDKNTLFHIDIPPEWSKFCMEIRPEHTDYPDKEEILFSCYNVYQYVRVEKSNNQRIIKLKLKKYRKYYDYRRNVITANE